MSATSAVQQLEAATAQFYASLRQLETILGVEGVEEAIENALGPQAQQIENISNTAITNISQAVRILDTAPVSVIPSRAMKSQVFTITNATVSPAGGVQKANQFFPSAPIPNRTATFITPPTNSGTFWLGDATVNKTQYGMQMVADTSYDSTLDDLAKVYYVADTVGDVMEINWEWGYGKITP
jgi:hypothetical protein